jgi:Spy/CpxP family protein refolding chaperone
MKTPLVISLIAGLTAITTVSAAEKKASTVGDYPFWTSKKRGNVGQFVPGLNAVLQLTDAQREQIAAARDEMANNEEVKAARGISKSDPSVTAEQRDKARAAIEAATTRLREKVATILTPEQKELIEKINAAYAAAVEDTGIVYADKFASVKADEAARRRIQDEKNQDIEEQFFHKLDGILTASQREAMSRAAEEEARSASAATAKKPAKQ